MSTTTPNRPPATGGAPAGGVPTRVDRPIGQRLLARPELGALIAAVVIFGFFFAIAPSLRSMASISTVLYEASVVGIPAVAVGLLMIGGEFDLSAGVATISTGLFTSMICYQLSLNMWVGTFLSLLLALVIGFVNGYLVVKTQIPSFLITLGTYFILWGVNLGVTKLVTGSVATVNTSDIEGFSSLNTIFAAEIPFFGTTLKITVLWWILFVLIAAWTLQRTRIGNWIFAVGGNPASARAVGVPVDKVKIGLFMGVTVLCWFYGMHRVYGFNGVIQAGEGVGQEFFYIIAVVVGGTLLTGGFGSAFGIAIGCLILAMARLGIVYAGWDPNWFRAFLGVMLLLAVMVNLYVKKVTSSRRLS
ncbi:ABC transporter permease [Nakamurella sp. YIM 132087]|uniref:Xylose transport system permease protein XylH n=1 Tax=Nakamurella alba TaxID=2665158 RepID=A0A7K1FF36_9ACTN|nr:ABC transporter permease [Nakamurella alba]MTD12722.1 ABC transporter permease [Nakamurella alba]